MDVNHLKSTLRNRMSIKEQLQNDLKDAMRSGDGLKKRTLRMALSAIKLAEVDSGELDDAGVIAIVQKEIKTCQETIVDAQRSGHDDLIRESQARLANQKTLVRVRMMGRRMMGSMMMVRRVQRMIP